MINRLRTRFEPELLPLIARSSGVGEDPLIVQLGERERALLWKNGRLSSILGRGLHASWREPFELEFETFQVESRFPQ